MFRNGSFKLVGFLPFCLCGTLLFSSSGVYAQTESISSVSTEATSVLMERTKEMLKDNRPAELVPLLKEILVRVRGNTDSDSLETRAFCMYQIGLCQMSIGQYAAAAESLNAFINEFPKDSMAGSAELLAAECFARTGNWLAAEKYARSQKDNKTLEPARRMAALQILAEALYNQQRWQEAIVSLLEIFEPAEDENIRARTAVMLCTSYAKLNNLDKLYEFLPHCGELLQQSGGLNVALVEFADAKSKEGDYQNALFLYRLVLLKDELIASYEKKLAGLKVFLAEPFVSRVGSTRSAYDEAHRVAQLEYDNRQEELNQIKNSPSYDTDVALRIAQCYAGMKRNVPAYTLYHHIYTGSPSHALAEDARFHAFSVMLDMQNVEAAQKEGETYMSKYPQGRFVDEVSLNLMQLYLQQGETEMTLALGLKVLELRPDHRFIDQVKYLLGYLYFQEMDCQKALSIFSEVHEKWPDSIYTEACDYWIAMCHLFMGQFDRAEAEFRAYLNRSDYPKKRFVEDSSYRLGIAQYGIGDFEASEATFLQFIRVYPASDLISEAYSMLGDLRGAEGDLDIALEFYAQGYETAVNVEQINYSLFQSAAVYELQKRYEEIITIMKTYLAEWGDESNYAGAGFWMGKAYKALGKYVDALAMYVETVVRYGNNLENNDVDLILRELIKEQQVEEGRAHRTALLQRLTRELSKAKRQNENTLALRLETLLAYITDGTQREKHISSILADTRIEDAGPLTLLLVANKAQARGNNQLVHETYAHCVAAFEESEILLDVMNIELQTRLDEKDYDGVLELAEEITNRFGYRPEVGITRKLKADAYRLTKQHAKAIETYTELFAVSEWRGSLTPEALYWIGSCKLELGEPEEAFAFFQRVYVLYDGYTDWAAKAYEASVQCLQKLGNREDDIIRTVQEMLANEKIAATPEGQRARATLNEILPAGGAQ